MDTFNGLPLLKISLEDDEQGVDKISLVDEPAIGEKWLMFSKVNDEEIDLMFEKIVSEQKLAGALLIPDKPILRRHPETGEKFYVTFPKKVISQIAERFNKNLFGANWNTQHSKDVNDVYVVENWIIEDSNYDKSKKFGHTLPSGTWYGIIKVDNDAVWTNEIENGNLRGFSVELVSGLKLEAVDKSIRDFHFENHVRSLLDSSSVRKLGAVRKNLECADGFEHQMKDGKWMCGKTHPNTSYLGEEINERWKQISINDIAEDEEFLSEEAILKLAIQAEGNEDSNLDVTIEGVGEYKVRYRYTGPKDNRNRDFCASLLDYQSAVTVFRREDINRMSFTTTNVQFGTYSIFRFKGSFGCRHFWKRLIFFEDYEDNETRRVGNVPSVTGRINDREARTINADLKKENMKKKFAMLDVIPLEDRIVGASVDNENGNYTIEGMVYVVVDNIITEIYAESVEDKEIPKDSVEAAMKLLDVGDWEGLEKRLQNLEDGIADLKTKTEGEDSEVMRMLAETQAKLEDLTQKVNGTEETTNDQFSAVKEGVDKITSLLELLPSKEKAFSAVSTTSSITMALNKIKAESKRV